MCNVVNPFERFFLKSDSRIKGSEDPFSKTRTVYDKSLTLETERKQPEYANPMVDSVPPPRKDDYQSGQLKRKKEISEIDDSFIPHKKMKEYVKTAQDIASIMKASQANTQSSEHQRTPQPIPSGNTTPPAIPRLPSSSTSLTPRKTHSLLSDGGVTLTKKIESADKRVIDVMGNETIERYMKLLNVNWTCRKDKSSVSNAPLNLTLLGIKNDGNRYYCDGPLDFAKFSKTLMIFHYFIYPMRTSFFPEAKVENSFLNERENMMPFIDPILPKMDDTSLLAIDIIIACFYTVKAPYIINYERMRKHCPNYKILCDSKTAYIEGFKGCYAKIQDINAIPERIVKMANADLYKVKKCFAFLIGFMCTYGNAISFIMEGFVKHITEAVGEVESVCGENLKTNMDVFKTKFMRLDWVIWSIQLTINLFESIRVHSM